MLELISGKFCGMFGIVSVCGSEFLLVLVVCDCVMIWWMFVCV